jgi:hypothetical protein
LPIGKDDDAGAKLAQDAHDGESILKCVGNCAISEVERLAPANAEDAGGFIGFTSAIGNTATSASFALRQIENRRAQTTRSHAQQRSSAGLFYVVAMRGDGEDVGLKIDCHCGHGAQ